ncbi:MAG: RteC domain-containing protein [Mucilaginibacter sp.]|uniref:RteC domain-containing protein n=1 Tax=Mucilaginibacter sp. TaxID=1882438 RepID=UPI003267F5B0
MLPVFAKQEYLRMEDELEQIAKDHRGEHRKRMTTALRCTRQALDRLFAYILKNPFKDKKEEIYFFKATKPQFYAHYIFEVMLYNLSDAPVSDHELLRAYYLDELRFIQRDLKQHNFLYQYFRLGADELDELYFVRGVEVQSVLIPEVPELDKAFSTSGDYLFSKFRAYEMLQEHIAHTLAGIGQPERAVYIRPGKNRQPLKWTGEQINGIELGYGLWLSGQLNGGEASLADVMYWLSESLDVDLSKHTSRFEEIKERKIISPTRFIDSMRDSVRGHIDDLYGLPALQKRKAKRTGSKTGR